MIGWNNMKNIERITQLVIRGLAGIILRTWRINTTWDKMIGRNDLKNMGRIIQLGIR
jgi:hypothetical protein